MLKGIPRLASALTFALLVIVALVYLHSSRQSFVPSKLPTWSKPKSTAAVALDATTSGTATTTDFPTASYSPNTQFAATPLPSDDGKPNMGEQPRFTPGKEKPPGSNYTRILVLPKTIMEDISWIHEELPDLPLAVYEVDKPDAERTVPINKGREAMVYLTYLIDNYDSLPDTILFFHAHRYAWHNNYPMGLDSVEMIRRLRDERVARVGYMPARCNHDPGCPDWIHMDRPEIDYEPIKKPEEPLFTKQIWRELHPGAPIPPALSQPCCAQFALSRDRVRQIPRAKFIWYRDWLTNTKLDDAWSGRVFEYMWQYIFTGYTEYCPAMNTCYCDGYGICFGGVHKLEEFEAIVKQRDEKQSELDKLKDGLGKNVDIHEKLRELQKEIDERTQVIDKLRQEAYARGEDLKNINAEAERLDD